MTTTSTHVVRQDAIERANALRLKWEHQLVHDAYRGWSGIWRLARRI